MKKKLKETSSEKNIWGYFEDSKLIGPFSSEKYAETDKKARMKYSGKKHEYADVFSMTKQEFEDASRLDESMSQSQKKEFYERLNNEKVHFEFRKKDGTVREAYGTLMKDYLPSPAHSYDTRSSAREKMKRAFPEDSVLYFDLEKNSFRSFKMQNFLKYID